MAEIDGRPSYAVLRFDHDRQEWQLWDGAWRYRETAQQALAYRRQINADDFKLGRYNDETKRYEPIPDEDQS